MQHCSTFGRLLHYGTIPGWVGEEQNQRSIMHRSAYFYFLHQTRANSTWQYTCVCHDVDSDFVTSAYCPTERRSRWNNPKCGIIHGNSLILEVIIVVKPNHKKDTNNCRGGLCYHGLENWITSVFFTLNIDDDSLLAPPQSCAIRLSHWASRSSKAICGSGLKLQFLLLYRMKISQCHECQKTADSESKQQSSFFIRKEFRQQTCYF